MTSLNAEKRHRPALSEPAVSSVERERALATAPRLKAEGERFRALSRPERRSVIREWKRGGGVTLMANANDYGFPGGNEDKGGRGGGGGDDWFKILWHVLWAATSALIVWLALEVLGIMGLAWLPWAVFMVVMSFLLWLAH